MKIKVEWDYSDNWVRFIYENKTYNVPKYIVEHLKYAGEEEYKDKLQKFIGLEGFLL